MPVGTGPVPFCAGRFGRLFEVYIIIIKKLADIGTYTKLGHRGPPNDSGEGKFNH